MGTFIQAQSVGKTFQIGEQNIEVLKDINVEIVEGDFAIIFGPSGSGKSTLLHSLLGLEKPTTGSITVEKQDFYTLTEDERAMFRRNKVGMIYQQALWINSLNVLENVVFGLHLLDNDESLIEEKGMKILKQVGMEEWAYHRPHELSSGQQQKISLARALIVDPVLLVADEPTGNLDTVSGQNLINTFLEINNKKLTIVMITHDLSYLKYATKLIHMLDGKVVEVYSPKHRGKIVVINDSSKEKDATGMPTLHDPQYLKKLNL